MVRILISSSIWKYQNLDFSNALFFFRTQPYNRNRIDWPEPYFCFTARVILKLLTSPLSSIIRGKGRGEEGPFNQPDYFTLYK